MIEFHHVEKQYGKIQTLSNVSFQIKDPGLYLFMGINGSGKSTILKLLSQVIYKTKGDIQIQDTIAYLPDRYDLPKLMKVKNYVKEILRLYCRKENPLDLLNAYQIPLKKIGELSKGNLQKLGILQVLIQDADCYIFDEPLDGLDDFAKKLFKEEILKKIQEGKRILLSIHNKNHFQDVKPTIYEIKGGICYAKKKKL